MTSAQSSKTKSSDIIKRLFLLGSLAAFAGSFLAGLIPLYLSQAQSPSTPSTLEEPIAAESDAQLELQQRERGFEIVLEREPNNSVALEGLAQTRLELGDAEGAIAPLEMLVKAYPDRADYQELLATAQELAATPEAQP